MTVALEVATEGRSLRDILQVTSADLAHGMTDQMLIAEAKNADRQLARRITGLEQGQFSRQVADQLSNSFDDERLVDVFGDVWGKFYELRQSAADTLKDPKSSTQVALLDHEFNLKVDIGIEALLNGLKVATLPFSLVAVCNVSGLELSLKGGAIYQVQSGKLDCRAEIRCADNTIWKRALAGIDLPGEIRLEKPIPLAREPRHAAVAAS